MRNISNIILGRGSELNIILASITIEKVKKKQKHAEI